MKFYMGLRILGYQVYMYKEIWKLKGFINTVDFYAVHTVAFKKDYSDYVSLRFRSVSTYCTSW